MAAINTAGVVGVEVVNFSALNVGSKIASDRVLDER
jgi:hypothetical protein